jgi:putative ABC transport system permease protein
MAWHHRVWNVLRRRQLGDDVDEELRFHIESSIRAGVASGMSPEEARQDARRRFGNPSVIRDRTQDADLQRFADELRQNLAFAIRSLRKRPAFAGVALLTLALGIGATTAIFTLVRSVLLRPLPFVEPGALHVVSYTSPGQFWLYPGMLDEGYLAFREANRTFDTMATFAHAQSTLTGEGDAARLVGAMVTTDFFRVLGVTAVVGRTFEAGDGATQGDRVVVIANRLWRGRFGARPGLLNQTISLNGLPYRVVGILPPGFSYPADATYWIPLVVRPDPRLGYIRPVIGRLKPGVSREQAQADLDVWTRSLPPDARRPPDLVARVTPLHEAMVGDVRRPLLIVAGAVALVLLIVCANVANLLLMRAVTRRQEIATRLALGADRGRLVRQLLTESALLSLLGGAAGAGLAMLAGPAIVSALPSGHLPEDIPVRIDGWELAVTAGLSMVTGLIVGLAPIAQTTRESQYAALRAGAASATRRSYSLRHALVVAQIALTLTLLVGAGLLLKSFMTLRGVPLGFTTDHVMTMTIDLPLSRYRSVEEAGLFHDRLLAAIAAQPDVQSAAAVNWLPLGNMVISGDVYAADRLDLAGQYGAVKSAVSPEYFETLRIRVLRGRTFTAGDHRGSQPVLIVSESVSRRLWPDGGAIGKLMALKDDPRPEDWLTVVGVVEDVRQHGLRDAPAHAVYQPIAQVTNRFWMGYMTFLARTRGEAADTAPQMREALNLVDRNEAPESLATLEAVVDRTVAEPRFQARVVSLFSVLALFLAAIGLYGVLASSVLERRVEIGVRMALGANRMSVVRLVVQHTMALTALGVVLGLGGALALTRVLKTLLFNVAPTDISTFVGASAVLATLALAAAWLPARRASSIDPMTALRAE